MKKHPNFIQVFFHYRKKDLNGGKTKPGVFVLSSVQCSYERSELEKAGRVLSPAHVIVQVEVVRQYGVLSYHL